ncbi:MAG: 5'-methylthioadenosine/adenosylhomocysteine nucleosidase [Angelakisella sp.]|jgi:adenosylhomocysteine nucleosidase|nr:5'-methylthioadenosine/adenosylhomocysteine nucleosidase [Angelakisella sp.]MCI9666214.1 5'-methylthioadenosine/adenosylhomocysteine nucleosidase [Angelakisella sp.]
MKVGIMCATQKELDPLLARLENKREEQRLLRSFVTGEYAGLTVTAVIGGVGKVNGAITAQSLIQNFGVEKIIFTGLAGGLDETIQIGDVVIGAEILHHDLDMKVMENDQFPGMPTDFFRGDPELLALCQGLGDNLRFGRIVTGEAFITAKERDGIIQRFHPQCVDMESAAVAQVCWFFQVPLLVIRALSDNADEEVEGVYSENSQWTSVSALQVVFRLLEALGKA